MKTHMNNYLFSRKKKTERLTEISLKNNPAYNFLFQKDEMSEKSPLQMLAQTCSQIGVDSGPKLVDKPQLIPAQLKNSPNPGSPINVVSCTQPVTFKPLLLPKK